MKKRKYVLLILTFLTALLCSVGSSLWLVLDEKNVSPTPFVGFDIEIDGKMEGVEVTPSPTTPVATLPTIADMYYGQSGGLTLSGGSISIGSSTLAGTWKVDGVAPSAVVTTAEKFKVSSTAASTAVTVNLSFTPTNTLYKELQTTQTVNVKSVAYHGSNYYSTLKGAVDAANANNSSAQNVVVIPDLGHEVIVNESVTVKEKVSLYVPFTEEKYDIDNSRIEELHKLNTIADSNATGVTNNRATLIKMQSGADLTVNSGAYLYLGGEFSTKGIMGKYAEINLDEDSQITCSGEFICYGYVKENADNAKNGNEAAYKTYYDNSYDSERYIQIAPSGSIKTALGIYDMKAISAITTLNDLKIFPFALFDFPNLQTYVEIQVGGTFSAQTHAVATASTGTQVVNQTATIISADTSESSVFYLTDGDNMGIEFCPTNKSYTTTTSLTRFYLNGTIKQGTLEVTISLSGITSSINTTDSFLPISYKFNIFINSGAKFYTNNHKIKFLPGANLKINSGGEMEIDRDIIFYEGSDYSKILSYPSKGNAVLINNGTLTLTGTGVLGALIQTEATDDSATVDFSACESSAAFTATATENTNELIVKRTAEGYFEDTSEEGKSLYQFVAGSTITSSPNGTQCWYGSKYALYT
ncbi:MAG: hypothetical protein IKD03_01695, partial [Clostridia bacterium]|nr:hypothetical protein [Clostridia bacterium]